MTSHGIMGRALASQAGHEARLARLAPSVPAHEVPRHRHAEAHLVAIERGHYLSSADGAHRAPGDTPLLVFNPPGTEHVDCFAPAQVLGQARFLSLHVGFGLWQDLQAGLHLPGWALALAPAQARTGLRRMRQVLAQPAATPLDLEGLAAELLGAAAAPLDPVTTGAPHWLQRTREALHDDPACALAPAGLARLAREAGVHPVHLARCFRRCFRQSPGEYARSQRLQAAAAALVRTRLPLAEVALAAGYFDQAHFTRAFVASYGTSPAHWRAGHSR